MLKQISRSRSPLFAFLAAAIIALVLFPAAEVASMAKADVCGSGKSEANLTGWPMDGKYPKGRAVFDQQNKQLTVTVDSVPLPDGTTLRVLIGDDRIGDMEPLKNGSAKAVVTGNDKVENGSRVRVFDKELPIVSGNLACVETESTQNSVPQQR